MHTQRDTHAWAPRAVGSRLFAPLTDRLNCMWLLLCSERWLQWGLLLLLLLLGAAWLSMTALLVVSDQT